MHLYEINIIKRKNLISKINQIYLINLGGLRLIRIVI